MAVIVIRREGGKFRDLHRNTEFDAKESKQHTRNETSLVRLTEIQGASGIPRQLPCSFWILRMFLTETIRCGGW